ncbi:MAG: TorF family putative porin, partial [Methylophilaceae bacterium]
GLTAMAHVGHQNFAGAANNDYSYTDWKWTVDKEFKGLNLGVSFVTTNIDNTQVDWAPNGSNTPGENRWVGYVAKEF